MIVNQTTNLIITLNGVECNEELLNKLNQLSKNGGITESLKDELVDLFYNRESDDIFQDGVNIRSVDYILHGNENNIECFKLPKFDNADSFRVDLEEILSRISIGGYTTKVLKSGKVCVNVFNNDGREKLIKSSLHNYPNVIIV